MAEDNVSLTPEQLKELVAAAVAEAVKPSPREAKKLAEEEAAEVRKNAMIAEMGRIEQEAANRRKHSCTHKRYPAGHKLAGHSCPRNEGEWTTGGQAYQDGTVRLLCLRCQNMWRWRPGPEIYNQILADGMLGWTPPPEEQLIAEA